jgi:hypothetical protein
MYTHKEGDTQNIYAYNKYTYQRFYICSTVQYKRIVLLHEKFNFTNNLHLPCKFNLTYFDTYLTNKKVT